MNTQKVYSSSETGIKNLNVCVYAPLKAPSLTAKYAGLNSGQVINYIEDRSFGICATLLEPHPTRSLPGMISWHVCRSVSMSANMCSSILPSSFWFDVTDDVFEALTRPEIKIVFIFFVYCFCCCSSARRRGGLTPYTNLSTRLRH